MRKRQQGSQQREGIRQGKAIVAEPMLEFIQLGSGIIVARKLQQALQMVDDRIERTVLVIGGAAKLNAGHPLMPKLLFDLLNQPRFANAGFATEQDYLACTLFGLLPALL